MRKRRGISAETNPNGGGAAVKNRVGQAVDRLNFLMVLLRRCLGKLQVQLVGLLDGNALFLHGMPPDVPPREWVGVSTARRPINSWGRLVRGKRLASPAP